MKIIGFNFTKVNAERLKDNVEDLKISTELDFPDIKDAKSPLLEIKDSLLEVSFEYKVIYAPGLAEIVIGGKMLLATDTKTSEDVLKQWEKRQLPDEFRIFLVNVALRKSTLKALSLGEELNLPAHVPIPSLKKNPEVKK